MDAFLLYTALFLIGPLALAGFACYVCRGRPVRLSLTRQQAWERRALQEIERHLIAEAKATETTALDSESGRSRQLDQ